MAAHRGMFYGYREYFKPVVGRVQLGIWELDGKIPTRNVTNAGNAADAYPAMVTLREPSEILLIQSWDSPLMVKLSTDGVTYNDEFEVDPDLDLGSWIRRYAARGFTVKNKTPGSVSRYQVVSFN